MRFTTHIRRTYELEIASARERRKGTYGLCSKTQGEKPPSDVDRCSWLSGGRQVGGRAAGGGVGEFVEDFDFEEGGEVDFGFVFAL